VQSLDDRLVKASWS